MPLTGLSFDFAVIAVPEPAALLLASAGLAVAAAARRQRRVTRG